MAAPNNFKPVEVLDMLNANLFVVKIKADSDELKRKYSQLERSLVQDWENRSRTQFSKSQTHPFVGSHVMVKSCKWNGIRRGVVIAVLPDCREEYSYEVFVYDHGQTGEFKPRELAQLDPLKVNGLSPRTWTVTIPGVVPVRKVLDLTASALGKRREPTYVTASEWSPLSRKTVKDWIKDASIFLLEIKKIKDGGNILGDLYRNGEQSESLEKFLVASNLARYSESLLACQFQNEPNYLPEFQEDQISSLASVNDNSIDTRPLSSTLDFEEQVREAEIQLENDRRPFAGHTPNAQEEERTKMLNKDSFLFNSKHRLTALGASGITKKCGPSSRPNRGEKQWIHGGSRTLLPQSRQPSSTEDEPSLESATKTVEIESGTGLQVDDADRSSFQRAVSKGHKEQTPSSPADIRENTSRNKQPVHALEYSSSDSDSDEVKPEPKPRNAIKLLDKDKHEVSYGCISLGDVPGRTLIRGCLLLSPLPDVSQFKYYDIMKISLKNCGIEELNVLQKTVAPHFLRGDDCFIIGGRGCGKSLSYLIPLVGSLISHNRKRKSSRKDADHMFTEGPRSIIICADLKSAIKIEGHLHNLSANRLFVGIVCDDHRETRNKCEIGLDIMVTTHAFAVEMIRRCHSHFKFDRLRFMVFDGVDTMMQSSPEEFENIRITVENYILKSVLRKPYQRILCGHEWSEQLEELYFKLPGLPDPRSPVFPTVHIQSRNQAIRYSDMKWKMYQVAEKDKIDKIIGLLRSSVEIVNHKNIFIVCSTPELAFEVHSELDRNKISTELVHMDTLSTSELAHITKKWESIACSQRIMVLHDTILRSLKIYNVTCLIHYDLPLKQPHIKSSAGADRFSCMWGHFKDVAKEKKISSLRYQRQQLDAYFLLTGTEKELYRLKTFALKMGFQMPEKLRLLADEMGKLELAKKPLCGGLIMFGKCMEAVPENCSFRHGFLLEELQKTPAVPRSGEIEVKITRCLNPSSYVGQVLRYYELKNGKKTMKDNLINVFNERTKKLNAHYAVEDNKVPPESFDTGAFCGVKAPDEIGYTRAKIEKVMTRTAMNFPKTIRVFCIDYGEYLQPMADNLLALPDGFAELPQLAVKIILANLQPPNSESDYRMHHIQKARALAVDRILHGKICLSVEDTVWLNPLVEMNKDPITQRTVKGDSIRLEIIHQKNAENNAYHMEDLIKLCKSSGFDCPEFNEEAEHLISDRHFMSQFCDLGVEVRWAFLPTRPVECPETVDICTSFTKAPSNIFGTQHKFENQLWDLTYDIDKQVKDMISENCKNYETEFESYYEKGLVVAVKDRVGDLWVRGMIMSIYEEESISRFDIFMVDIGDVQPRNTTKQMFPLLSDFVTRLPFQAIGFDLAHIKPVSSSVRCWDEDATKKVIQYTFDENMDAIVVEVAALESQKHPTLPCRYYRAMIFLGTDNGDEIGQSLVKVGAAMFVGDAEKNVKLVRDKILAKYNQMYDGRKDASEDEDSDEADTFEDFGDYERWDVTFDMHSAKEAGIPLPPLLTSSQNTNIEPPSEASQKSRSAAKQTAALTEKLPPSKNTDTGGGGPLPPFSDLLHPKVYWRQTKTQFILTVLHPDIRKYDLTVEGQNVSLRTTEPPNYGFDIVCFGRLHPEVDEFLTGQYLRIKLNKRMMWKWPQPMKDNVKLPWFKEDPDNVHESDDEEEPVEIQPTSQHKEKDDTSEDEDDSSCDSDEDPEETDKVVIAE